MYVGHLQTWAEVLHPSLISFFPLCALAMLQACCSLFFSQRISLTCMLNSVLLWTYQLGGFWQIAGIQEMSMQKWKHLALKEGNTPAGPDRLLYLGAYHLPQHPVQA